MLKKIIDVKPNDMVAIQFGNTNNVCVVVGNESSSKNSKYRDLILVSYNCKILTFELDAENMIETI